MSPKFEWNKDEYQEWIGKVDEWMWRHKKLEGFPGFKLIATLKGNLGPWWLAYLGSNLPGKEWR